MDEELFDSEMDKIMDEYTQSKDEDSTEDVIVASDDSQEQTEVPVEAKTEDEVEEKPQEDPQDPQEEATEDPDGETPAKEKKTTGGINKKIKKLTAQRRQAERDKYEIQTQNAQLMKRLEELEQKTKPVEAKKDVEDFDSLEDWQRHLGKEGAQSELEAYKAEQATQAKVAQENAQLGELLTRNEDTARKYYADYDEVIQDFPSNLPMSIKVQKHLAGSPAGPLTMYNMTCNEEVVNMLNRASTQDEVEQVIIDVHNKIWDELKAQPASTASQKPVETQPQGAPVAPIAPAGVLTPPAGKAPVAPPKQGKTGAITGELQDLEGDAFFDEFSKMYN